MKIDVVYNKSCQRMTELPDGSIDMCMTSPPYWGLRDYGEDVKEIWGGDPNCEHEFENYARPAGGGHANPDKAQVGTTKKDIQRVFGAKAAFCQKCGAWYGQFGLEPTFQLYLDHMMIVCAEIKRVLKKTGSFWLNMGDTYGGSGCGKGDYRNNNKRSASNPMLYSEKPNPQSKNKAKCLLGIPWRLVLRLIDEQGWVLRNAGIWNKPNSMPSSTKDRLSNSYEFLFHLVKNTKPQYYWNEKTGLMADRKPKELKEGIDWNWQECPKCSGAGKIIQGIKAGDNDFGIVLSEKGPEICPRCKGTGKIKHSFWHSLGYWYDLDAIREPHTQTSIARLFRGVDPGNKYDYANNPVEHSARNLSKPRLNIRKITRGPKEIPFKEQSIRPSGGDHHLISNMLTSLQKSVLAGRGKNPGDVWTIPTQPRPEAHFATFPDALCIKPILATCPAEICKKCGKARVRIIEKPDMSQRPQRSQVAKTFKDDHLGFKGRSAGQKYQEWRNKNPDITIGWTDCGCNAGWDSGVLLDPFTGKGTALEMAKKLGRHYVGYELKKEYCEKLIKPALEEIDPLFNWKTPSPAAG